MKPPKLLKAEGSVNVGHGHVLTRPDGKRMRCGGPRLCADCRRDLEQLNAMFGGGE